MRISDWSSDVCSSDLDAQVGAVERQTVGRHRQRRRDDAEHRTARERFPTPRLTDDPDALAVVDDEVDTVDEGRVARGDAQTLDLEQGRCCGHREASGMGTSGAGRSGGATSGTESVGEAVRPRAVCASRMASARSEEHTYELQ